MNTAKTTNVTVASILDLVKGETYVYQGQEVVVVKLLKKSNQVIIKGEAMKDSIKVNVNELANVELSVEEVAMNTAVKTLNNANNALTKAMRTLREIESGSDVVGTAAYKSAVEAKNAALAAVREADANLVAVKYPTRGLGRFNIKTKDVQFNVDELEAFYQDAMENYTDVDKEAGKKLSHIYGFIAIVNVIKIAKALIEVDAESEYTTAFRIAMHHLLVKMTRNTESPFVNIWHLVFGGETKRGSVNALETVIEGKYKTAPIRNAFAKSAIDAAPSNLVSLDDKGINIRPLANTAPKRLGLRDAVRKLDYIDQIIFVRTKTTVSGIGCDIARAMTALQKLIGLHVSGIALEGLRNNSRFSSVVKIGFHGKTWTSASVVLDPVAVLKENTDDYTAEELAIADALRSNGYSVAANPENYGKHGYVQLTSTYNRKENNAFINADGSSCEDMSKLIVRLMKQSWNPGEVQFSDMRTIVVGLVSDENLPSNVDTDAQVKFNEVLGNVFVAGPAIASKKAFSIMGTGRFVTGSEDIASGQKTVVCDPAKTMVRELSHVYFNVGGGHEEEFVIASLNSTKSTKFKYTDGWVLTTFEVDGKTVALYVKETKETYKLTFSATANAYRAVDEKLVGVEAAMNSLARSTNALQSETATKLIYANNGKTLAENIVDLLSSGRIARKGMHVATNSQFNQGLELQHGVSAAKEILTSLVRTNIASHFRNDVVNSLLLAEGSITESDIGEVSAKRIVQTIANGCSQLGLPLEDVKGKVMHVQIVKAVMKMFAKTGKQWVRIRFDDTRSVLFPITQDLLESFEGTQRPLYVALQGVAAELFESFAYFVQNAIEVEEDEFSTFNVEMTDSQIDVAIRSLSKARDAVAGKPLNKVPTIGATLLLATSAHLRDNEVYSSVLNALGLQARASFRQAVTCLYFKSPLLWKGSISTARLVDQISTLLAEWLEQFGGDKDYNDLMQGTCSYISSVKAVKNGNDADGDLNSFVFVATRTLDGTSLSNTKHFIDATDVKVAAGAHHYATKWNEELASLVLNTNRRAELKSTEGFEKAFEQAVVRAAKEKANVAIFTSHQTTTLNYRGAYQSAFEGALKRVANHIEFEEFSDWAENLLSNEFAMNAASEALWSFNGDVQGSCVNFDAMDQVKSAEGRNIKKLASLLSAGELKFVNFSYAKTIAHEDKTLSQIRNEVNKGVEQRSLEIYNTMFNPRQHNIAIDQLQHILPAYTEKNAAVVKKMVAYMMVVCGSNVGNFAATKYDVCQAISATAKKVNGRGVAANLETLASVQSEKGREKVEIDCVQRTIVEAALEFNNKVLF